ncbi:LPXTG cell wall anchor domain-containing protein, partial [Burkholderia cenocepacia]|uniref:LPXTG cell wall anchor domain-containing protein n=1 Tax=Burkholderia cenocepacia TaxID=95486 RepID=UPI0038CBF81A
PVVAEVDAPAADLGYDWTVRVSGATSYGVVAIGIREGAVTSGYGLANAAIEASVDGTVVYAPAVVAPAPVAPTPVASAPVAPAPVAALPQTGGEPLWGSALVALLVLAAGTAVRRRARRG